MKKTPKFQEAIKLKSTQVLSLDFNTKKIFDKTITDKLTLNFQFGYRFPKDDKRNFIVIFDINIFDENEEFSLNMKFSALFETNLDIDEEFKNSSFVQMSAPAIAFPYLRSFISNLTLNAGFNPVFFPSINFTNYEEKK